MNAVDKHHQAGDALVVDEGLQTWPDVLQAARKWFCEHSGDSVFATNRFGETSKGIAFVEALYAVGATAVLVEEPHTDAAGDPCADTLLVRFTADSDIGWEIQRFCDEEGRGDVVRPGFDAVAGLDESAG